MRIEVGKPTTFVDISVKTKGGERYIIEMQTYNHEGLDKRLLYYLGKDYTEQLDYLKQLEAQDTTRKQIGWQDLPRVHIIAIADFHRSKAKKKWNSQWRYRNRKPMLSAQSVIKVTATCLISGELHL